MDRIARIAEKVAALGPQYESVNDAAEVTGNDGYLKGITDIWYMKPSTMRDGIMGYDWLVQHDMLPTKARLNTTHVYLGSINERDVETVFALMQGEAWSPRGEARSLIQRKGLHHTSMSVGDVVVISSAVFLVDMAGFKRL